MIHRGNAVGPEESFREFSAGGLARPLGQYFRATRYLTPYSDVVAHLVLAHQTRVHNSIAKASIEARAAMAYREEMKRLFGEASESTLASVRRRIQRPSESLVRDLLMVGEARLSGPVFGDSGFAEDFQGKGSGTGADRSLRTLDLQSRLFRFPCSFLIRSPSFQGLPAPVREYVERRIGQILAGKDSSGDFGHLSAEDRRNLNRLLWPASDPAEPP